MSKIAWQQTHRTMAALIWSVVLVATILWAGFSALSAQDDKPTDGSDTPSVEVSDETTSTDAEKTADDKTEAPDDSTHKETDSPEPAFDDIPWELRPYRLLISIAFGDHPSLTAHFRQQLQQALESRIAGVFESYWQFEIESNQWLLPPSQTNLRRQNTPDLTNRFTKIDFDKVIVLTVEDDQGLVLSGWEWDRNSEARSPVLQRDVIDRRLTTDEVFELLIDLFRPVARIDSSAEGFAELRARGGELLAPESVAVLFQPGDLLSPHYRYLNREGEVRSIQSVPWTYLRVKDIVRSRFTCGIETAFAAPLATSRRRVELMAIRVRPEYKATTLRLVPRTNPNRPLVGVRVRVYDQMPTEEEPNPGMAEFMTNRSGEITIPTNFDRPVRRLLVHSGGAVLANLPFVTGHVKEVTLEVPDDSPRLEVEGNLAIIQGELIDLVTRRSVMLARALSMARKEELDESKAIMAEVDKMPSISSFKSKIIAVRVPAVRQAQANRDKSAVKRINKMCRELEELVDRYLAADPVRDAKAEIKELRELYEKPRRRKPA